MEPEKQMLATGPVLPPSGLAGDGWEQLEATLKERPQRWTNGDGYVHMVANVGSL